MAQFLSKPFGMTPNGEKINEYIISNPGGLAVSVLNYGCIIKNIWVPTKRGPVDVVLGHDTYTDYLKRAKPSVRFSIPQLISLARRFARSGHATDAEKLTRVLARRSPGEAQIPGLLLMLAEAFRREGNIAMRDAALLRLQQEHPGSDEACSARAISG